jgi:ABC-type glycerol-3-phosphate transport system permease component
VIIPRQITFEHFAETLSNPRTARNLVNSLVVTSITTIVTVITGTLAA